MNELSPTVLTCILVFFIFCSLFCFVQQLRREYSVRPGAHFTAAVIQAISATISFLLFKLHGSAELASAVEGTIALVLFFGTLSVISMLLSFSAVRNNARLAEVEQENLEEAFV